MVRRGGRTAVATSSSSSVASSNRWNRSRPSSATGGDLSGRKESKGNNDSSAKSSPNVTGSRGSSPVTGNSAKKGSTGKPSRGTFWKSRGSFRNANSPTDPKFSITNEDFPELPGARSTVGRNKDQNKKEKEASDSPRPNSADSLGESVSCPSTTDDSGLSTSSRGNTPQSDTNQTSMKKFDSYAKFDKKKMRSPNKEYSPRSPRDDHHKTGMNRSAPPPYRTTPKKKNEKAAPPTTPSSFIKLSKSGQKVPERRGLTISVPVPKCPSWKLAELERIADEEKKKQALEGCKLDELKEELVIIAEENDEKSENNTPKIVLADDGVMSNIPSSMIDDQFGLAAMLPILNFVKKRGGRNNVPDAGDETLGSEERQRKMFNDNIEMLAIGVDLNTLGVPNKNYGQKPVFETFSGPYASHPMTPTNMGLSFHELPSVYYTARTLSSSFDMNQKMPEKVGNHELFYIFYNFPRELWQLNAARELQHRHWRFNIRDKIWIRKHSVEPDDFGLTAIMWNKLGLPNSQNAGETISGVFEVYDPDKARISTRELTFSRADIEFAAWEMDTMDDIQKTLVSIVPPEGLWGPKSGNEEKPAASQTPIGTKPNGYNGSKIMNVLKGIASEQQLRGSTANSRGLHKVASLPNNKRLLSFADLPDQNQSMMDHSVEDPLRQQMYSALFQQILQQGRNNHHSANNLATTQF